MHWALVLLFACSIRAAVVYVRIDSSGRSIIDGSFLSKMIAWSSKKCEQVSFWVFFLNTTLSMFTFKIVLWYLDVGLPWIRNRWIGEMGAAAVRTCRSISSTFRKQCHIRPDHLSWCYVPREIEASHLNCSSCVPSLSEYAMAHGSGEISRHFKLELVIIVSRCTCNAIPWTNDKQFFTNWEINLTIWKTKGNW